MYENMGFRSLNHSNKELLQIIWVNKAPEDVYFDIIWLLILLDFIISKKESDRVKQMAPGWPYVFSLKVLTGHNVIWTDGTVRRLCNTVGFTKACPRNEYVFVSGTGLYFLNQ